MKAIKVFCIIFTVIAMAVTGLMFALSRLMNTEAQSVTGDHESKFATVTMVGDEYTYKIENGEAVTETEYLTTLNQAEDAFKYAAIGGGVVSVLLIAGAAASGKAAKRRDAVFAAA